MNGYNEYHVEYLKATVPSAILMEQYFDQERFLALCKECVNYGRLWSCPPYETDGSDLIRNARWVDLLGVKIVFSPALIEATKGKHQIGVVTRRILEKEKGDMDARVREMERNTAESTALSSGGCHLCRETGCEDLDYHSGPPEFCSRMTGKPCRKPNQMRYSLEALGFDVSRIAEDLLKTPLLWSAEQLPQYFVLVNGLVRKGE